MPIATVFYVSYHKDYDWFTYSYRSLKKYGSGFAHVMVAVPHQDGEKFRPFCEQNGILLRTYLEVPGKEFLHHEVLKCEADIWVPADTEIVVHIDSDCIFVEKFSLDTYMHEGRPILPRERYEDFRHYPSRYSWKRCVDYAIGGDHEWETMTRHPSLYYAEVYGELRRRVEKRHRISFQQFVLYQKNTFPQSFAELPTIGAMALDLWPEKYQIVDVVITPSAAWADPKWEKFGIKPGVNAGKTLWHLPNGEIEERPLVNPMKYYWSRFGVDKYRVELDANVA